MNGKCAGACALALVLLSPTTEAQTSGSLDGAVWLAGDWVLVDSGRCVEEHWTAPSANSMVGAGRTVKDGRTTSFEFMRIEARADGIFFVAQPGGRAPIDFKLAGDPGSDLVFLNPGHADHLTRVIYRHGDGDSLNARVEGADAGKPFAVDYAYRRASTGERACAVAK
jgi:hypothetical protein